MKILVSNKREVLGDSVRLFATFSLNNRLYGLDVAQVQEVTKALSYTLMKGAPAFIRGLINLRGQIATAVDLKDVLNLEKDNDTEKMTVVCRQEEILISFAVDSIGDVIELPESSFELAPLTIPAHVRRYLVGVYKMENQILSVLNLKEIIKHLEQKTA